MDEESGLDPLTGCFLVVMLLLLLGASIAMLGVGSLLALHAYDEVSERFGD